LIVATGGFPDGELVAALDFTCPNFTPNQTTCQSCSTYVPPPHVIHINCMNDGFTTTFCTDPMYEDLRERLVADLGVYYNNTPANELMIALNVQFAVVSSAISMSAMVIDELKSYVAIGGVLLVNLQYNNRNYALTLLNAFIPDAKMQPSTISGPDELLIIPRRGGFWDTVVNGYNSPVSTLTLGNYTSMYCGKRGVQLVQSTTQLFPAYQKAGINDASVCGMRYYSGYVIFMSSFSAFAGPSFGGYLLDTDNLNFLVNLMRAAIPSENAILYPEG